MPIAKTYLPKQWTDWTTWLLGIWLCLSPWTLLFEFEAPAVKNAVLLGALIILAELVELSFFAAGKNGSMSHLERGSSRQHGCWAS
jgi:hypothetical protein